MEGKLDMEFSLPADIKSLPELRLLDGTPNAEDILKIGRDVIKERIEKSNSEKVADIKKAETIEDKQAIAKWLVIGIQDLRYWIPNSTYQKVVDEKVVTLTHKGYGVSFKRKYRNGKVSKRTTYFPLTL